MSSEEDIPLTKRSKQPIKRAGKVEDAVQESPKVGKIKIESVKEEKTQLQENSVARKKVEKKHYDKLGQTKGTPGENDPERIFYWTLSEQRPKSDMAKKWLLQHGLLAEDEIEKYMKEEAKHKPLTKPKQMNSNKDGFKPTAVSKQQSKTPAKTTRKTPAKKQPDELKPVKVQKTQAAGSASRGRKSAPLSSRANNKQNSRQKRGRAQISEDEEDGEDVPLSSRKRANNGRQKQSAAANKRKREDEEESEEDDIPLSKRGKTNGNAAPPKSRRAHAKSIVESSDEEDDVPLSARAKK